jgi:soluble lytic murein transglycosylase-like protein
MSRSRRAFDPRRIVTGIIMGVLGLGVTQGALADIYKFVDERGITHFTDHPTDSRYKLFMRGGQRVDRRACSARIDPKRFYPIITRAARRYQLEEPLLHAVITAESAYNPNAVSSKGAVGLMQLMPKTARRYGVRNRYDPVQNVNGGARYLRDLLGMFKNDIRLAVAAYNAGENAVIKHGRNIPPYRETKVFVAKVMTLYRKFRSRR